MRKLSARTRRIVVGVVVGAPLLFGGSYFAASAATAPSNAATVQEVPMVLDIPIVAGVTCETPVADGGVEVGGANVDVKLAALEVDGTTSDEGAAGEGATGDEGAAGEGAVDATESMSPCARLESRGVATPLEIVAELPA